MYGKINQHLERKPGRRWRNLAAETMDLAKFTGVSFQFCWRQLFSAFCST